MNYKLWEWFTKEEEEKEDNTLKEAIIQNKATSLEVIQLAELTKTQSRKMLRLAENALKILETTEKKK